MADTKQICESCGKQTVKKTPTGLYCTTCKKEIKVEERAVHHEGFPHVVTNEEEP